MKLKNIFRYLFGKITGCYNFGKNNNVIVIKCGKPKKRIFMPKGLKVQFEGDNCTAIIEKPLSFQSTLIVFEGDNAEFSIKTSIHKVKDAKLYIDKNCSIEIGKDCQLKNTGLVMIANSTYDKPVKIMLGDNVYIARDVLIRASDGHTLIDAETREPLNPPQNIVIDDNVWITSRCVILKGAHIPKGSIVGACSLVNKKFDEENVVIAGVPAKIVKHGITWNKLDYGKYKRQFMGEDD